MKKAIAPLLHARARVGAACALTVAVGLYFHLSGQPIAVGLLGAYDKLGHLTVYAGITGLLWLASGGGRPGLVFGAVALMGVTDEWYQSLLPGRVADVADFVTDVAACAMTLLLLSRAAR